ncbi:transcriptional regulator [Acidovorax sp. NPDC077693]|uniref:transcriptional regulator n=1 Tax=unclassified Acidovorax TaxID=2684926 RepID=UPI0037C74598
MDNKLEFAERLRDAMVAAGLEPRPGVLLSLFNGKYWGRSVTFQAVSRWLKGEAIPAQDKLVVLAELLKIEPEVLRFGSSVRHAVQEHRNRWQVGVGYLERETFDAFLQLPAPQRKLVREIILTFAKVYPAPPVVPPVPVAPVVRVARVAPAGPAGPVASSAAAATGSTRKKPPQGRAK